MHGTAILLGGDKHGSIMYRYIRPDDPDDPYLENEDETDILRDTYQSYLINETGTPDTILEYARDYYGYPIVGKNDGVDHTMEGCEWGWVRSSSDDITDLTADLCEVIVRSNPNGNIDYYGLLNGFLLLKDGTSAQSARKKDVDFPAMENEVTDQISKLWDEVQPLYEAAGVSPNWTSFNSMFKSAHAAGVSTNDIYKNFRNQPAVQVLSEHDYRVMDPSIELIAASSKTECINNARLSTYSCAFLCTESSFEDIDDFASTREWQQHVADAIVDLPDDEYVAMADCHF